MSSIPERDWKQLRAVQADLLNGVCERVFQKIDSLAGNRAGREHEAYLRLWKLLKSEDRKVASMFDDLKRSTALQKLAAWRHYGALTDNLLGRFSDETQKTIRALSDLMR
ncbi:MAG: hypothetical protein V2A76_12360 [Planctomycetota bacterium]